MLPQEAEGLRSYAGERAKGRSFGYHLGEGTVPSLREEFDELSAAGCLHPQLVGIHSTALGEDQWRRGGLAAQGAS